MNDNVDSVGLREITRADRSPLNRKVWCYQLACGHDVFRPGRKKRIGSQLRCEECERHPQNNRISKQDH